MGAEKYGIEVFKKAVEALADVLNVTSSVMNHGGIWQLFGLKDVLTFLSGLDVAQLKAEALDLSDEERKALEDLFKAKLNLVNKEVQEKMGSGLALLEDVVVDVQRVIVKCKDLYTFVLGLYADGQSFYSRLKALVG